MREMDASNELIEIDCDHLDHSSIGNVDHDYQLWEPVMVMIGKRKGNVKVMSKVRKSTPKSPYGEDILTLGCECGIVYTATATSFLKNDNPHCGCLKFKDMHKRVAVHMEYAYSLALEHDYSPETCKECALTYTCDLIYTPETNEKVWNHGTECQLHRAS
jgi:hypothetical protein